MRQVMRHLHDIMYKHDDLDVVATRIQAKWRGKIARRKTNLLSQTDVTLHRVLRVRAYCVGACSRYVLIWPRVSAGAGAIGVTSCPARKENGDAACWPLRYY